MSSANFAQSVMILLVFALLSVAGSTERDKPVEIVEFVSRYSPDQSQIDLNAVLNAYWNLKGFLKYTFSYGLYRDKTLYGKMTLIQRAAVVNEIVCDTDDSLHNLLKRKCVRFAQKCEKSWKKLKVAGSCVNNATTAAEKCYCDHESIPVYCEMLQAQQDLLLTVKGDCTADELEYELSNKSANLADYINHNQLRQASCSYTKSKSNRANYAEKIIEFAKFLENVTHNTIDLNDMIPYTITQGGEFTKTVCETTLEIHRVLRRLKNVSTFYCLIDDEMKRNVLGTQPYDFCEQDTFLGKCMCDPEASSIFCLMKFSRLLMDTYAGDEKLNCTSSNTACITFFSWTAIISILGLKLLG